MLNLSSLEAQLGKEPSMKYWNRVLLHATFSAISYGEMSQIAMGILRDMPQPISEVCGPISSGGLSSVEANLDYMNKTIQRLVREGENVFNQMPFEGPIQALRHVSGLPIEESTREILNEFYLPLFESGLIKKLYFVHNWSSSFGANWERSQAKRLKMGIVDLLEDFV